MTNTWCGEKSARAHETVARVTKDNEQPQLNHRMEVETQHVTRTTMLDVFIR